MPSLVERPIAQGKDRLNALARLASQLHPKKPLERGYAIVRSEAGEVLTTREQAGAQAALSLEFKDGEIAVGVGDAPPLAQSAAPKPATKPKKPSPPRASPRQEDLFG